MAYYQGGRSKVGDEIISVDITLEGCTKKSKLYESIHIICRNHVILCAYFRVAKILRNNLTVAKHSLVPRPLLAFNVGKLGVAWGRG